MASEEIGARLSLRNRSQFARQTRQAAKDVDGIGKAAKDADRKMGRAGRAAEAMGRSVAFAAKAGLRGMRSLAAGVGRAGVAVLAGAAAITAALVTGGLLAIRLASDAAETASKFEVTFAAATGAAQKWVDDMHGRFGIARADLQDLASGFGILVAAGGIAGDQLASMSTSLAALALDVSSKFNVSVEDAGTALRSGLVGETEPLRRFGIVMNDAMLKARGAAMGFGAEMTEQEKILARYALISELSAAHTGDLEKTAGGAANQWRAFTGRVKEYATMVGRVLLPIAERMLNLMNRGMTSALAALGGRFDGLLERTTAWSQRLGETVDALIEGGVSSRRFGESAVAAFGSKLGRSVERVALAVAGVVEGFKESKRPGDILASTMETLFGPTGRRAMDKASEILDRVRGALGDLKDIVTGSAPGIQAIGAALAPIALLKFAALQWFVDTALPWLGDNPEVLNWIVPAWVGIAAALEVATGAQTAMNVAMAANPVGAVVLAVAALAGGLAYAYKNSEKFRQSIDTLAAKGWRFLAGVTDRMRALAGAVTDVAVAFARVVDFFAAGDGAQAGRVRALGDRIDSQLQRAGDAGRVTGGVLDSTAGQDRIFGGGITTAPPSRGVTPPLTPTPPPRSGLPVSRTVSPTVNVTISGGVGATDGQVRSWARRVAREMTDAVDREVTRGAVYG